MVLVSNNSKGRNSNNNNNSNNSITLGSLWQLQHLEQIRVKSCEMSLMNLPEECCSLREKGSMMKTLINGLWSILEARHGNFDLRPFQIFSQTFERPLELLL